MLLAGGCLRGVPSLEGAGSHVGWVLLEQENEVEGKQRWKGEGLFGGCSVWVVPPCGAAVGFGRAGCTCGPAWSLLWSGLNSLGLET